MKNLRLVCSSFGPVTSARLFRRICISFLKSDHDAFFGIACKPYLCCHVKELVWYDINIELKDIRSAPQVVERHYDQLLDVRLVRELIGG